MTRAMMLVLTATLTAIPTAGAEPPPDAFPRFIVPGHEEAMASLRALHWLHYPGAGPKATLWDEWLSRPALWPAEPAHMDRFRTQWDEVLSTRIIDPEGYVATHQHGSIAHQLGWPFPFWKQGGDGAWGWHFSLHGVPNGWHGTEERTQDGWTLTHAADEGIRDHAWHIRLTAPGAAVTAPPVSIDPHEAPFIQLRWRAEGLDGAEPYLEWIREDAPAYSPDRRMHFPLPERALTGGHGFAYTMIPVYRHPGWTGRITGLRIQFNNPEAGAVAGLQALFTQYDTRHTINGQNFLRGCANYFLWTRDLDFLRRNINRMRTAFRYTMDEFDTEAEGVIVVRWVGHDGRSGIRYDEAGQKHLIHGNAVGNNYWDLMPMGHKDALATIYHYDALRRHAEIERAIDAHPEWDIPCGVLRLAPGALEAHADQVKAAFNATFWNPETGRFACSIDIDGTMWDYGFTFLNLEAIHFGIVDDAKAARILEWIGGDRIVAGDTSQGDDIYFWRFGPRSTTRRNIDYYLWSWSGPETIPFGGQVQDGGAVLGWSYHDLMARLAVRGPDDAAARLSEVITWFDEITAAGGYRTYYDGTRPGKLQGGGTAGGLGLDQEFFESLLVPQVMLDGFLGFHPTAEGFRADPKLPKAWPALTVNRIRLRNAVLTVRATHDTLDITVDEILGVMDTPLTAQAPAARWRVPNAPTARGESAYAQATLDPTPGSSVVFERVAP